MSTFLLEIITPDRVVFSDSVSMVTLPTVAGEIGILAHHIPLFTKIVEGEVKVKKDDGSNFFLAVGSGFIEVTPKKTTILLSSAYKAEELNEAEILEAKKRAEEALRAKPVVEALIAAQNLFMRSTIALNVLNRQKKRGIKPLV